ncbi:MAG: PepSY domain-containing protein [Gammaproteobacteria bacterium]|nr:PepSY domain-containing protein [Gammaproteobacteria bacterium]
MNAPSCRKWLLLLVLVLPLSFNLVYADALLSAVANVGVFAGAAEPKKLVAHQSGISMEEATNIVRGKFGGRVLSAAPVRRGDQRGFEIRMLLDGKKVKKVFIDDQGRVKAKQP